MVVPPDNPESIAKAIIDLSENRSRCFQMGSNARKYAEEHFSKAKILPKLADLIEGCHRI